MLGGAVAVLVLFLKAFLNALGYGVINVKAAKRLRESALNLALGINNGVGTLLATVLLHMRGHTVVIALSRLGPRRGLSRRVSCLAHAAHHYAPADASSELSARQSLPLLPL